MARLVLIIAGILVANLLVGYSLAYLSKSRARRDFSWLDALTTQVQFIGRTLKKHRIAIAVFGSILSALGCSLFYQKVDIVFTTFEYYAAIIIVCFSVVFQIIYGLSIKNNVLVNNDG